MTRPRRGPLRSPSKDSDYDSFDTSHRPPKKAAAQGDYPQTHGLAAKRASLFVPQEQ